MSKFDALFDKFEDHPVLSIIFLWTAGIVLNLILIGLAVLLILFLLGQFGVI